MKYCEFSNPVVVEEGVAFRVSRKKDAREVSAVVVATKARLRVGQEAQGLAVLAAFVQASKVLFEEVALHLESGAAASVLYL